MRETLLHILALQPEYDSSNTSAMERRGYLVRQTLRTELRGLLPAPGTTEVRDWEAHGSDGVGRKTIIPWCRVYSRERSPSATFGWYVVYLFSATGDRVYLSVNQGTTRPTETNSQPRPAEEFRAQVEWAQTRLRGAADLGPQWHPMIDLDSTAKLATAYEFGNVYAVEYRRESMPPEPTLRSDLAAALRLLTRFYGLEDHAAEGPVESAEVADMERAADALAGRRDSRKVPFRQNAKQRQAIERHAVHVTTVHLRGLGFTVEDVGATHSYDLHAVRAGVEWKVEVKGTTSSGSDIVLTSNEVSLDAYPNNALAIVHSIRLSGGADSPETSGGKLSFEQPWHLDQERLTPISYRYQTRSKVRC